MLDPALTSGSNPSVPHMDLRSPHFQKHSHTLFGPGLSNSSALSDEILSPGECSTARGSDCVTGPESPAGTLRDPLAR
ncbi:unnamed protein product, partial [Chrysoparadoxa australica]